MAACNDPLMRGVVCAPGWTRDIRAYVRSEYAACSDLWFLAELSSRKTPVQRRPRGVRLRRLLAGLRTQGRPTEG